MVISNSPTDWCFYLNMFFSKYFCSLVLLHLFLVQYFSHNLNKTNILILLCEDTKEIMPQFNLLKTILSLATQQTHNSPDNLRAANAKGTVPNFYSPISIIVIITANLLILNRRLLPHSEAAKTLHLSKLLLNKICPQAISNSVSILLTSNSCRLVCV